jgi:hypothetical protein
MCNFGRRVQFFRELQLLQCFDIHWCHHIQCELRLWTIQTDTVMSPAVEPGDRCGERTTGRDGPSAVLLRATLSEMVWYCEAFTVLETPFGLLLCFIYDFTSRHYNYIYNVHSSLPCLFLILAGPLIDGFLVAALIWFLWSALFYCSPPSNRVLAPRIEDTLWKGSFFFFGFDSALLWNSLLWEFNNSACSL